MIKIHLQFELLPYFFSEYFLYQTSVQIDSDASALIVGHGLEGTMESVGVDLLLTE